MDFKQSGPQPGLNDADTGHLSTDAHPHRSTDEVRPHGVSPTFIRFRRPPILLPPYKVRTVLSNFRTIRHLQKRGW